MYCSSSIAVIAAKIQCKIWIYNEGASTKWHNNNKVTDTLLPCKFGTKNSGNLGKKLTDNCSYYLYIFNYFWIELPVIFMCISLTCWLEKCIDPVRQSKHQCIIRHLEYPSHLTQVPWHNKIYFKSKLKFFLLINLKINNFKTSKVKD